MRPRPLPQRTTLLYSKWFWEFRKRGPEDGVRHLPADYGVTPRYLMSPGKLWTAMVSSSSAHRSSALQPRKTLCREQPQVRMLSTPWNQLEAGIAYAMEKPLLIMLQGTRRRLRHSRQSERHHRDRCSGPRRTHRNLLEGGQLGASAESHIEYRRALTDAGEEFLGRAGRAGAVGGDQADTGAAVKMSSTVSAPSWVTVYSNSARVTSIPSATCWVGRSQLAVAITFGASAPYRALQRPWQIGLRPQRRTGFAGAPTSGRLQVRQVPARSPRNPMARSMTSSAIYRYSVSFPPTTLMTPDGDSTTACSRETSAVRPRRYR